MKDHRRTTHQSREPIDASHKVHEDAREEMAASTDARETETEGLEHIQQVAARLVREAAGAEGSIANFGDALIGSVKGAIDAAQESGIDRDKAAQAAAAGALEAAAELGEGAVEHIKKLVSDSIGNVRPISKSTFAKGRRTP